ncbi:MAG: hypothetical protein AAFR61_16635 [Bacteroidota bacterium]
MKFPRTSILAVCVAALGLMMGSCTNYPNGPAVSLQSAISKISNVVWTVREAANGNTDLTASFAGDTFEFADDGTYRREDAARLISLPPFTADQIVPVTGRGEWEFVNGSTQIELFYTYEFTDPYNSNVSYREDLNEAWDVYRLTTTELWLQNGTIFLKLIPQDD